MKANILLCISLLFLIILPLALARAPYIEKEYAPGTLIVKLDGSKSLEEAESILKSTDKAILDVDYLFDSPENMNSKAKSLDMDQFLVITIDENADSVVLASELSKLKEVENVELNYVYETLSMPNDPKFPANQWGLHNYGQEIVPGQGVYGTPDIDIDAPEAWDIETGDSDIVIAVLDTGIDYNHPDLQNKVMNGWDFISNDDDPMDLSGHGTKVAGVAGAETNNGIGVASLCQGCTLMPVRVCSGSSCYYNAIISGIYYAADNGADVISMSFGSTDSDCIREALDVAIQYAYNMDVVLVAAAGNEEGVTTPLHPACREEVIGVAGYNPYGSLSMSRHGDWIDVAAPGTFIMTTILGGTYNTDGGTSMATPFVSGLAGLLLSSFGELSPSQIRDIMMLTSEELLGDEPINPDGGRINAHDALSVCIVEDEIIPPNTCVVDNKPYKCVEQQLVKKCQECGCPEGKLCEPDGRCIKPGKPKIAIPSWG